jgi:tetratricopeptide (TPR) repeat protein
MGPSHDNPSTATTAAGCPDAQQLAAYADGLLTDAERQVIEEHLNECASCRAVLAETMIFVQTQSSVAPAAAPSILPFRGRRPLVGVAAALAAAAAIVIAIRIAKPTAFDDWFGTRSARPELQELVAALANEPTRPVVGRLTGGFKYAPPASPTRGPGDRDSSPAVRIAAARIEKQAQRRASSEDRVALGVALLAVGELDRAIEVLTEAARQTPSADAFNDLSAAHLTRANRAGRDDDFALALAAADRALQLRPASDEALFNKALALAGLKRVADAQRVVDDYLRRDDSSPWSRELRAIVGR